MKKRYCILLLILLGMGNIWSEQQATLLSRTRQFTIRLKESCVRKLKQQYQDKHKRRWWLSSGAVCLASFISWRLGAFQRIGNRKQKSDDASQDDQSPADTRVSPHAETDPPTPQERAEQELIENTLGEPSVAEGRAPSSAHEPLPAEVHDALRQQSDTNAHEQRRALVQAHRKEPAAAKNQDLAALRAAMAATERLGGGSENESNDSNNVRQRPLLGAHRAHGTMVKKNDAEIDAAATKEPAEDDCLAWGDSVAVGTGTNDSLAPYNGPTDGAANAAQLGAALQRKPEAVWRDASTAVLKKNFEDLVRKRSAEGLSAEEARKKALEDMATQKEKARAEFQQGITKRKLATIIDSIKSGATLRVNAKFLAMIFELETHYDQLSSDEQINLQWIKSLITLAIDPKNSLPS